MFIKDKHGKIGDRWKKKQGACRMCVCVYVCRENILDLFSCLRWRWWKATDEYVRNVRGKFVMKFFRVGDWEGFEYTQGNSRRIHCKTSGVYVGNIDKDTYKLGNSLSLSLSHTHIHTHTHTDIYIYIYIYIYIDR